MTPRDFIAKWRASELKERSASQEHFIDLCRLLDEPTPAEADPTGNSYCFEKGARKETGGDGWADVWKRHCFAWEYKGQLGNLDAAFDQLRQYALALENPPLLIASDMRRFYIRTNWTNSVSETHDFDIDDLADDPHCIGVPDAEGPAGGFVEGKFEQLLVPVSLPTGVEYDMVLNVIVGRLQVIADLIDRHCS